MSTMQELTDYLTSQGVTTSGLIFQDFMPDAPDVCLTLYLEPGSAPELGFGNAAGVQHESPTVQVVSRSTRLDSVTAENLAWDAFDALAKVQAQTLGSTYYLMIRPLQSPSGSVLGPDANQRPRYSFNATIRKELS